VTTEKDLGQPIKSVTQNMRSGQLQIKKSKKKKKQRLIRNHPNVEKQNLKIYVKKTKIH